MSTPTVAGQSWPGPPPVAPPPPAAGTPGFRRVGVTLAVFVGAAVLGVPYALLWALAAPDIPVVKVEGGVVAAQPEPEQFIAGDGWFVLLGVAFGVLAAIAVWLFARRSRGPVVLVALVLGLLTAGLAASWLGPRIGLDDYRRALAAAAPGTELRHPPALRVLDWPKPVGVPLVVALAGAVTYALSAAWSRHDSLRPEPRSPWSEADSPRFEPQPPGLEPPGPHGPVSWGWSAPRDRPAPPAPPGAGAEWRSPD